MYLSMVEGTGIISLAMVRGELYNVPIYGEGEWYNFSLYGE